MQDGLNSKAASKIFNAQNKLESQINKVQEKIDQSGYVYIFVSNEILNSKVWFDDLTVTHNSYFRLTQATDYETWGGVLREQKTDESVYWFGYQGQYAEKDKETGWNHFEAREFVDISVIPCQSFR